MRHEKKQDLALLILRLAAGVIFVLHGYGKLFGHAPGMTAFTGMVAGMHLPLPMLFAYMAACSEFFGGIALILGVFPRAAAFFISMVMLVALAEVKKFRLPMADPDYALLAIAIAVGLMGVGKYSLTSFFSKRAQEPVKTE